MKIKIKSNQINTNIYKPITTNKHKHNYHNKKSKRRSTQIFTKIITAQTIKNQNNNKNKITTTK
jgi:hypothetical protein